MPKGGKSLIKTLTLDCDIEFPDEFFELNPDLNREKFENELLNRFEEIWELRKKGQYQNIDI